MQLFKRFIKSGIEQNSNLMDFCWKWVLKMSKFWGGTKKTWLRQPLDPQPKIPRIFVFARKQVSGLKFPRFNTQVVGILARCMMN